MTNTEHQARQVRNRNKHVAIADGLPVNPLERHVFKPIYGYEAQPTGPCVICTKACDAPVHQFGRKVSK